MPTFRLAFAILTSCGLLLAQNATPPGVPPNFKMPPMPKAGICPIQPLPALPDYTDTAFYSVKDVPHGTIEKATYKNFENQDNRMHIYLPPGYEKSPDVRYPVLYLNHGGGADDSAWVNTHPIHGGFVAVILDNLIAAGKAKPMIVVMPNTRQVATLKVSKPGEDDRCTQEYLKNIIPYIDGHYRTKADRANRALAGLSMGGAVVMNVGLPHLDTFSELFVYSSGYFPDEIPAFEANYGALLRDPKTNDMLRVPFYLATGETDIARANANTVVSLMLKWQVKTHYVFSSGGHDWANWRRYLYQTAQILFPDCGDR